MEKEKSDCSGHCEAICFGADPSLPRQLCFGVKFSVMTGSVLETCCALLRIVGGELVGPDMESNISSSPSWLLEMHWRLCDALLALCIFEEGFLRSEWVG